MLDESSWHSWLILLLSSLCLSSWIYSPVFFIPSLLLRWAWLLQWIMTSLIWCISGLNQVRPLNSSSLYAHSDLSECCGKTGLQDPLTPSVGALLTGKLKWPWNCSCKALSYFLPLVTGLWTEVYARHLHCHTDLWTTLLGSTQPNYLLFSCRHWGETEL